MSDSDHRQSYKMRFGFLVGMLVWGILIAHCIADWNSLYLRGRHWYEAGGLANYHFSELCFGIGAIVGLLAGFILDFSLKNELVRRRTSKLFISH